MPGVKYTAVFLDDFTKMDSIHKGVKNIVTWYLKQYKNMVICATEWKIALNISSFRYVSWVEWEEIVSQSHFWLILTTGMVLLCFSCNLLSNSIQ